MSGASGPASALAAIRAAVGDQPLARELHYLPRVESTLDFSRTLAASACPDGTLVVAGEQTGGRGRRGRRWHADPRFSLAFTLLLRRAGPPTPGAVLVACLSLAVCRALDALPVPGAVVKWPNDVLLGERKVCGILCEGSVEEGKDAIVLCGIGVNVNGRRADLPPEIREHATTLQEAVGRPLDARAVLAGILQEAARLLVVPPADVVSAWTVRSATLGRRVRIESESGTFEGLALGVRDDLSLQVRADDGTERTVVAADVVHLRAAGKPR